MLRVFILMAGLTLFSTSPLKAFEECKFAFQLDTQSSAFQALVAGASDRGGFWRPINEAPDDVRDVAQYIGRLDICLRTADGKPAQVTRGGHTQEIPSPFVTSCTAALLSDNRLLTNVHCFYDPTLSAAGFTVVDQVRVNFGYTAKDMVADVHTFAVANRETAQSAPLDAMVLQVLGDANAALGGHTPMVMELDPKPRRALTMIHHPRGEPQQFSSGTCQIHPRQSEIPDDASQLRHSCETAAGSSGSLLLDARSLAVVGLHNTGGLSHQGGYNGGHKIAMVEEALKIGFTPLSLDPPQPAGNAATDALLAALLLTDSSEKRGALESVIQDFPNSQAAESAKLTLTALTIAPTKPTVPGVITVAEDGSGQFTQIAKAIAAAPDGARIEIRPGNYLGGAVVDKSLSLIGIGEPGEIYWEAYDGDLLIWKTGNGTISNVDMFADFDSHALQVLGGDLRITQAALGGVGRKSVIRVEGTAKLNALDLTFSHCYSGCLHASDTSSTTLRESITHRGTGEGIAMVRVTDAASFKATDNDISALREPGPAIELSTRGPVEIQNNTFTFTSVALHVLAGETADISENRFVSNHVALRIGGGASAVFTGNEVSDDCGVAVSFDEDASGTVAHNDIRDCQVGAFEVNERAEVNISNNRILGLRSARYGILIGKDVTGHVVSNDLRGNDIEGEVVLNLGGRANLRIMNNQF